MPTAAAAERSDEPVFHLCADGISGAAASRDGAAWAVTLRLSDAAAGDFAAFTRAHAGATVRVQVNDRHFSRFTIVAETSDRVSRRTASEADARAWVRWLREELPEEPCGGPD